MRHRKKNLGFGRKCDQRTAFLRSLAGGLILYKRITTTEARAKALRPMIERMVTRGKNPTLANRRELVKRLGSARVANILVDEIAPKYIDRNGGYTRIVKKAPRLGDGAATAMIEFV